MAIGVAKADGSLHWNCNPHAYESTMTFICIINLDGVEQNVTTLEIGVFSGTECRGSALAMYYPQLANHKYLWFLTVHGDNGNILNFKVYDHVTNREFDMSCDSYTFITNKVEGNVVNPYSFDFVTNTYTFVGSNANSSSNPEPWNVASNWLDHNGNTMTVMPELQYQFVNINGFSYIPEGVFAETRRLSIENGKQLQINNGATLTITEIIENDDPERLVINDGGQMFHNNDNVAATFKKHIINPKNWGAANDHSGWQFISCPILTDNNTSGALVSDFLPLNGDYDLYKWDGSNFVNGANLQWVNYKSQTAFENYFKVGVGYLATYESQENASFKGMLNHGSSNTFAVTYNSDNEWINFTLLGNPFPYNIDWNDFSGINIYKNGYAKVNKSTGVIEYILGGTIDSGEGFMVYATDENPSLVYDRDNGSKSATCNDFIDVIVSNTDGYDKAIACFDGESNGGFVKLTNINSDVSNVYFAKDNKKYGICSFDRETKEIPLYFKPVKMGNHKLSIKPSGDIDYAHLIDRQTGADIDMLIDDSYSFIAMTDDLPNRFIIRLSNDSQEPDNNCFAYQSGNKLYINETGTVQIVDIAGRIIIHETLSGKPIDISSLRNAPYIIRLVNENGIKTQKIIVL